MKKITILLVALMSGFSALSQDFLTLLKNLETSTRNYQIDDRMIEFAKPKFNAFNTRNFIDLYNYTYDKEYSYRDKYEMEELLKLETSAEYLKYIETEKALREISRQRYAVINPISEEIEDLVIALDDNKLRIRAFRKDAEEVILEEEKGMQKIRNRNNTLNAISSFAAGFTGSSDNLTYWVDPSCAYVWTWSQDFSNEKGVPPEMRKNHDFNRIKSPDYIRELNRFIRILNEWRLELISQNNKLNEQRKVENDKWDKVESDFVQKNLVSKETMGRLFEIALERKYKEWYFSELKQIKDSFTRKFGPSMNDHKFVESVGNLANMIKEYSYDMQRYSSYEQEEKVYGISYDLIEMEYKEIQKNTGSASPKFSKIHESMVAIKTYVDSHRAASSIFEGYIDGKESEYFFYIRP